MVERGVDVGGVDAAPVAELRPDPVRAVRRRAADVRQDDAIAADATGATSTCGPEPRRRAARRGHRRRSAAARRRRRPGRRSRRRSARPGRVPGRGVISTGGEGRLPRRADRAPPDRRPAGRVDRRELHRADAVGREVGHDRRGVLGARDRRVCVTISPSTSARRPRGVPIDRVEVDPTGSTTDRDRRPSRRARRGASPPRAMPAGDHPTGEVRVDPVADRPVEAGREIDGRRRREPSAGATRTVGLRCRRAVPGHRAPIAATHRPSGETAGCAAHPAGGEDLARLGRGGAAGTADVDGPDRRPRLEVRLRTAVRGEHDGPAVRRPRDVVHAPVTGR